MPFPLVRLVTIIVDCIHNATSSKNQDEFCLFGGEFDFFVEKFCRKYLRPDQPAFLVVHFVNTATYPCVAPGANGRSGGFL